MTRFGCAAILLFGTVLRGADSVPQLAAFDGFVNGLLEKWQIPGAALGVSHDGRLVLERGYGFAESKSRNPKLVQPDSLFRIGGISKILTEAAILRLVEDGKLSPPMDYDYSLLGRVIEKASGQPYESYVKSAVLMPLGITRMQLGHTTLAGLDAAGGWIASVSDLLRLVNALDGRRPPMLLRQPSLSGDADEWNYGALDGVSAYVFRQAATGVDAVLLFNSRPRDSAAFDADLTAGLTRTVNSIRNWPALDLFVTGPELFARDIVNAADHRGGGVAPGEIVVMFPSNAGPPEIAEWPSGSTGATRVFFDNVAAPVVYTVAGQVSAIVPHDVSGKAATEVAIEYRGVRSPPVTVPVVSSAPGFFTRDASGKGQAAMLNVTGCCNSARNPAMRGAIAYLFATGEGLSLTRADKKFTSEKPSAVPVPVPPDVKVTVGGVPAEVLYAGDAGVLQVNIRVPENAPTGEAVPLVLMVGDSRSPEGVTIAVRSAVPRVLVMEHEKEIRSRLTEILQAQTPRGASCEVVTALDEIEVAERVKEGPVDLLITDLAMHPEAGMRTIRAIQSENPQLKIMIVSREAGSKALRAADLLGAQAVLSHMVTNEVLVKRVQEMLQEHFVAF